MMDPQNYAYVTWVIREEQYIGAAMVLCASWRRTDPDVSRVLLLAYDLANPKVINCVSKLFTHIIEIPYIEKQFEHKWYRFKEFYTWLDLCMTRIYAFKAMHQVFGNNTKFLLFDADVLVLHSMYDLFSYRTPAGSCSVIGHIEFDEDRNVPKGDCGGRIIDKKLVNYSLIHFWGMRAALYMFSSKDGDIIFEDMLERLKTYFPGCKLRLGPDERFLTEYYNTDEYGWTHISACYANLSWQGADNDIRDHKWVRALHYISQKPWWTDESKFEYWNDFDLWYAEAADIVREIPEAAVYYNKKYLDKQLNKHKAPQSNIYNSEINEIEDLEELFSEKASWTKSHINPVHTSVDNHLHKIYLDNDGETHYKNRGPIILGNKNARI